MCCTFPTGIWIRGTRLGAKPIALNIYVAVPMPPTLVSTQHLRMQVFQRRASVGQPFPTIQTSCSSSVGYLYCDSPPDLALSSFTSMHQFFDLTNVSFSIFTGDMVSHDNDDQVRIIAIKRLKCQSNWTSSLGNTSSTRNSSLSRPSKLSWAACPCTPHWEIMIPSPKRGIVSLNSP